MFSGKNFFFFFFYWNPWHSTTAGGSWIEIQMAIFFLLKPLTFNNSWRQLNRNTDGIFTIRMCKCNRDISVKVTVCFSGCLFQSSHLSNSRGSQHTGYWWESTVLWAFFAGVHLQLRFNASRYSSELMICHFECAGQCAQTLLWFLILSWLLCLAVTCALQKQLCLAEFQWEAKCKNMNKALRSSCLETRSVMPSFIQTP